MTLAEVEEFPAARRKMSPFQIKTRAALRTRERSLMYVRVSVRFDTLHVFSIHNGVLQNARCLHISLNSPTTCINNSAVAKRFQGKALPGACCRNEVSEHYSFSLSLARSLCNVALSEQRRNEAARSSSRNLHSRTRRACLLLVGCRESHIRQCR